MTAQPVDLVSATRFVQPIKSALSCNLDRHLLEASLPLLQSDLVEALEWSFDALFHVEVVPDWFVNLLDAYSENGRLIGHGVFYSLFSGRWLPAQQKWLDKLKALSEQFTFDHISEHFGFMTGTDFHKGAPLSVPFNSTTLAVGRDRLSRISQACRCPVGLENLAFSYSLDEVKRHGEFLYELISPVNGFIILDLHNVYCQYQNFDISFGELIQLYPLDRVREIHLSGGSWEESSMDAERIIRRDTHDKAVPEEVFELLQSTLPLCPQLKYVVLEQIGNSLNGAMPQAQFRRDFKKMNQIVKTFNTTKEAVELNSFLSEYQILGSIVESEPLYYEQRALSNILENAIDYQHAKILLGQSKLANSDWQIEKWNPYMLETAMAIAQKWK